MQPEDSAFSGVVFKVQANMDANHRDRIAFVRMASGKYTPGMKLKVQRTAKELRPTIGGDLFEPAPRSGGGGLCGRHHWLYHPRRRAVGRHHHRWRVTLQFTGLPFFAPELFMTVVLKNPLRTKQLQAGLGPAGRRRRDPGVQARGGRHHAAGRRGSVAV
jgi:peptide chain release factor 3